MIEPDTFRQTALSFPETTEERHSQSTSFLVRGRVFAIYDALEKRAYLQFSEIAQDVYSSFDRDAFYPGDDRQGWTTIDLTTVCTHILHDALTTAYCETAPQELADQIRQTWED